MTAVACALKLLGYKSYTESALRKKLLEKEFAEAEILDAIERIKGMGYIDDAAFAESFVRGHQNVGQFVLERKLRDKGVDAETASQACENLDPAEQIASWLKRRFAAKDLSDPKEKRRVVAFLQRKGFSFAAISRALSIDSQYE